jgi:hypothetical protein
MVAIPLLGTHVNRRKALNRTAIQSSNKLFVYLKNKTVFKRLWRFFYFHGHEWSIHNRRLHGYTVSVPGLDVSDTFVDNADLAYTVATSLDLYLQLVFTRLFTSRVPSVTDPKTVITQGETFFKPVLQTPSTTPTMHFNQSLHTGQWETNGKPSRYILAAMWHQQACCADCILINACQFQSRNAGN